MTQLLKWKGPSLENNYGERDTRQINLMFQLLDRQMYSWRRTTTNINSQRIIGKNPLGK